MANELANLCTAYGGDFVPVQGERINAAFTTILKALTEQSGVSNDIISQQHATTEKLNALIGDVRDLQAGRSSGQRPSSSAILDSANGSRDLKDADRVMALLEDLQARIEHQQTQIDKLMSGSIIIVDQGGTGLFTSVPPALAVAREGDTIVVRPGTYPDPLVMDKPGITIRGVARDKVIFSHTEDACTVVFRAPATLCNVSIRSNVPYYCAVRFEGSCGQPGGNMAALLDCDVKSDNLSCVIVAAGCTSPVIKGCTIHGSKQHGICCKHDTAPVIEENEIFENGQPNIVVEKGSNPLIQRNKIHSSGQNGVWFRQGALGRLVGNQIYGNAFSNVDIMGEAKPFIQGNAIHSSGKCGVCVADQGGGEIVENDIFGNGYSNVGIMAGANPTVMRNKIHGSRQHGILIKANAGGVIQDNTLWENSLANIKMEEGAVTISRNNTK